MKRKETIYHEKCVLNVNRILFQINIRALLIRHQFDTKCEGILKSFVDNNFPKIMFQRFGDKGRHLSCKGILKICVSR